MTTAPSYGVRLRAAAAPLLDRARALKGSRLHPAPDAQAWSAIEILAHVAEFVPYWADQALTLASGPEGAAFGRTHDDPQRIAAVTEHATDALDTAIDRVERGLARAATVLGTIPSDRWAWKGRHSRRGEMSVADIVESFMLGHLEEHAHQLDDVA